MSVYLSLQSVTVVKAGVDAAIYSARQHHHAAYSRRRHSVINEARWRWAFPSQQSHVLTG